MGQDNRPLNVIFLSQHCCIRVIKEGLTLAQSGRCNVHFMQNRIANTEFVNILPTMSFWESRQNLADKIRNYAKFDIIHVHNEPSWLGWLAKEVRSDMPVIFDAHDLDLCRYGEPNEDEKKVFDMVDGFIFPSEAYISDAWDRFKFRQPCEVVYSMLLRSFMPVQNNLPKLPGIVYEGGVLNGVEKFKYRDYRKLAKIITKRYPFHIYPNNSEFVEDYESCGASVYHPLPYLSLIRQLGRYDWGLCAGGHPSRQWMMSMPKKLFEYLAAGIPILAWGALEVEEFIKKYEVGTVLKKPDEIHLHYNDFEEYHGNIKKVQDKFTMESQINKILDLYQSVLGSSK